MLLETKIDERSLAKYVALQLNGNFPDSNVVIDKILLPNIKKTMARIEYCFSHVNNKYFFNGRSVVFDYLHGDQYTMFLYLLSREVILNENDEALAGKIFLLNKLLHGVDIYYEIELPEIFLLVHPLATVLGRGEYNDYFMAYQRCGVGSNHDVFPRFGNHVTLRPGSSVLGRCDVGNNVTLAADALLLDKNLDANTLYIGNPKGYTTKLQKQPPSIWRGFEEYTDI